MAYTAEQEKQMQDMMQGMNVEQLQKWMQMKQEQGAATTTTAASPPPFVFSASTSSLAASSDNGLAQPVPTTQPSPSTPQNLLEQATNKPIPMQVGSEEDMALQRKADEVRAEYDEDKRKEKCKSTQIEKKEHLQIQYKELHLEKRRKKKTQQMRIHSIKGLKMKKIKEET